MNVLYLMPARGSSQGLPKKNIKLLCGKPLIAWSIEIGIKASKKYPGRVVVSTDDENIASIAKQFGAEVPFLRPSELAKDTTPSMDVVLHVIDYFEKKGEKFDLLVMLEPTSPQRDEKDIENAIELLLSVPDAESAVGISKTETAHPAFLVELKSSFIVPYNKSEVKVLRRQDLNDLYFFEGSMYVSKIESLKKRKSFYHEKTLGCVMPKWKSFEVDDTVDFIIIESLMAAKMKGEIE